MGLDIRLPIGLMFFVIGVLLMAFGYFSDPGIYAKSLSINVNLIWGFALLLFGSAFLFLGRRGAKGAASSASSSSGDAKRSH